MDEQVNLPEALAFGDTHEYHRAYLQDLAATWKAFQRGKSNPFTGPYGALLGSHVDCLQQLYRVIWHGWEPIRAGLGPLCPESPGELFTLLMTPDPPRHRLSARTAADLLRGSTPSNPAAAANLRRIKSEILANAETGALMEAVLLLAKRATKGRGAVGKGSLKLALKEYEKVHKEWMRLIKRALNTQGKFAKNGPKMASNPCATRLISDRAEA